MRKAIFIDKDGTLVRDVPYNVNPEFVMIEDGAIEGLRKLLHEDYLLIVITNQSGLAHGYFSTTDLNVLWTHLGKLFQSEGINLDGFYFCPHHPAGSVKEFATACNCRKPMPGLFFQAASDFNIDLKNSWMIGDILNDVEAANRAGCRSILIDNGNETEWIMDNEERTPFYVAKDMCEAADCILQYSNAALPDWQRTKQQNL